MDRKRTIILCLAVLLAFGGAAASLAENAESIASMTETASLDTAASSQAQSMASDRYLKVPVGNILLKPPEDATGKRTSVDFPHSRHFDYNCKRCHHKWIGNAKLQSCSTQGCHDKLERPTRPGRRIPDPNYDIAYFKKAFHLQCIACHKDLKLQNEALELSMKKIEGKLPVVGPTSCVQCHPEDAE